MGVRQGPDPEVIADLKAFKAPPEILERAKQAAEINETFDVLPENWDAAKLFQAVKTQWRIGGMAGIPTGLDYSAVDVVMRRLNLKDSVFEQLQVMENIALNHWAETHQS